jgi:hypothetical protein
MVANVDTRAPSGLFPAGPPRPTFREPHPVRIGPVLAGAAMGGAWQLLVGLLAGTTRGYFYLTLTASVVATLAALVLMRFGDRGAAAGVAISAGAGLAVAFAVVLQRWVTSGWPLW